MRLHLKTLDLSLEGIRRVLEKNTVTITAMNAKFEALETQNTILIKRQTTLEQKESHISDQLHELRKLSTKTDLATGKATFSSLLNRTMIADSSLYNLTSVCFS